MGDSSTSKTKGLSDVANCSDFNRAPLDFIGYAQHAGDGILGIAACLHTLSEKMESQAFAYMLPDEQQKFSQLEANKIKLIDEVKNFILKEKYRFNVMRLEAAVGGSIKDLIRNVRPEMHVNQISQLQGKVADLQMGYHHFKVELEENCKNDGRDTKKSYKVIAGCIGCMTMVVGACAGIACLIAHFVPGINFVLTPTLWAAVAGAFAGSAAGGIILKCCMQQDEIDRAMGYLKDLQTNLAALKDAMQTVEAQDTVIGEVVQLEHFTNIAEALEARCDQIVKICNEVNDRQFCR